MPIKKIKDLIEENAKPKPFIYLFSATFPPNGLKNFFFLIILLKIFLLLIVRDFAKRFVNEPYVHLYLKLSELNVDEIMQYKIDCSASSNKKFEIIQKVLRSITSTKMIVFFNVIENLNRIERQLREKGFEDIYIVHSKNDNREVNMKNFKECPKGILLTTNVLSRGIDIDGITVVINYDLPFNHEKFSKNNHMEEDLETYVHRIGRTGRYGFSGIAINLLGNRDEFHIMSRISDKLFGKNNSKIIELKEDTMEDKLSKDEEMVEQKNLKRKEELQNN